MSTRLKIAFWCYLVSLLGPIAFGLMYLLRPEFMPYHAGAVVMSWAEVPRAFQVLILGLMRAAAGAWLALALALGVLLAFPVRPGVAWARWAVPAAGLVNSAVALYATLYIQFNTHAETPWKVVTGIMVLNIAGLLLSLEHPTRPGSKIEAQGRRGDAAGP